MLVVQSPASIANTLSRYSIPIDVHIVKQEYIGELVQDDPQDSSPLCNVLRPRTSAGWTSHVI